VFSLNTNPRTVPSDPLYNPFDCHIFFCQHDLIFDQVYYDKWVSLLDCYLNIDSTFVIDQELTLVLLTCFGALASFHISTPVPDRPWLILFIGMSTLAEKISCEESVC